jgi:hypothetical protein
MAKNKQAGMEVDPADEAALKPYVEKHGPNYYKPKVRQRIEEAQKTGTTYDLPEDPWFPSKWTEVDVRAMLEELGDERLYDSFYRRTSEWGHSGLRAILIAVDPQQSNAEEWGTDQFTDDDLRSGVWALGVACESLLRSSDVLNAHFSLEYGDRIKSIEDKLGDMRALSLASMP